MKAKRYILLNAFLVFAMFNIYNMPCFGKPLLLGVNLPSATFASKSLPGRIGVDYFYPNEEDIDYFLSKGMNVVRLGFIWERLQPNLNESFDLDEAQRLDESVQTILRRGATVILDLHNYARYRNQVVGSAATPEASFADVWGRLAAIYGKNDHIFFGLMNEPHDISASQWQQAAQAAVTRIRQTGARNKILVPSTQWSNASGFLANSDIWKRMVDPAENFAFEVHQYVDLDNTGTHAECLNPLDGVSALKPVTQWMQQNKYQAILGEFGGSIQKECLRALFHMLEHMQQESDVWLGWVYFAGGRGWADNDILSIQPTSKEEKPQMELLQRFLR